MDFGDLPTQKSQINTAYNSDFRGVKLYNCPLTGLYE
jgi:hypothetical protein